VFNARKLAAIDLIFLGPKVVITEFSAGVFLSAVLGIFVLVRGHHSLAQIVLGLYLISLGINYVPMLHYAIRIRRAEGARAELGNELDDKRVAMAKYRRQSLWLLVPMIVPLLALAQSRKPQSNNSTVS
jgi:hypothetical protein